MRRFSVGRLVALAALACAMMVAAIPVQALATGMPPWLVCANSKAAAELSAQHTTLPGPANGAAVLAGAPVTFSGEYGHALTFSVASSPALLSSPDIDSGRGSLQPGTSLYMFTSTKATATPRTIYWAASFTFTPQDCEGPSTFTTSARTLTVLSPSSTAAEAATTTGAEGQTPAVVPPNLQALEQKMAQIRFNTARVALRFAIGELGPAVSGAELGTGATGLDSFMTSVTAAVRRSPSESISTSRNGGLKLSAGHTLGASTSVERTIGKTVYTYKPSVASYDGGRPWVRSKAKPAPKSGSDSAKLSAVFGSLSPTFAASAGSPAGLFSKLIEELGEAQSIQEVGPATVDAQQVTEFTASISLAKLLSPKQLEGITKSNGSLGELLSPIGSAKQRDEAKKHNEEAATKLSETTVELELFIAPSGLPVRTSSVLGGRSEGIGVEEDILALEIPVVVHAPPARETIGEAQLAKLEKKHDRRVCSIIKVGAASNAQPVLCPRAPSKWAPGRHQGHST